MIPDQGAVQKFGPAGADPSFHDRVHARHPDPDCCTGRANQQWTAATNGTLETLGKCLDVTNDATTPGSPVQLYDCNGTGAQQWQADNGELPNPQSGLCLNDSTATSLLDINTCTNTRTQWFSLPPGAGGAGPTGPVTSGITGKCLDVFDGNSVDLTPADLYDCNSTAAQQWSLESNGTLQSLGSSRNTNEIDSNWFQVSGDDVNFTPVATVAEPYAGADMQTRLYRAINLHATGRYV
ncbi:RICIN domain-containing protein [Streptacidiphilus sp. PB12-B1b]|uniref:RICIN domain-containing protein n=1 Tax=Streptacidiphilus sp. PB12-B1b TaxID=2705012 RepID=UPI001CDBA30D|nr:RICIN domain-containing protein [Streptacidiphilus sp. PB12-B1b]